MHLICPYHKHTQKWGGKMACLGGWSWPEGWGVEPQRKTCPCGVQPFARKRMGPSFRTIVCTWVGFSPHFTMRWPILKLTRVQIAFQFRRPPPSNVDIPVLEAGSRISGSEFPHIPPENFPLSIMLPALCPQPPPLDACCGSGSRSGSLAAKTAQQT